TGGREFPQCWPRHHRYHPARCRHVVRLARIRGDRPMTPFRRLLRAAAVFVGANLTFLAVAAPLAPGWRAGQPLPSADPQPPRTHDETQPGATHRENVTVMRRDGSSAEAWIITPRDTPGTVPGVVLVHGAGSADRDAMLEEATTLAAAGVAAITYAKRDE